MTLVQNPVFLTQRRLVHRAGVLAAVLIAALVGLSLLSGLIACLADPGMFHFQSTQQAGRLFYGWVIGVEILVFGVGGCSRISRALADDRKAGLWDSNRLTPLRPSHLVAGYWFGAGLRELYMASVLAALGLVMVVLGKLPLSLWIGTQTLLLGAALFFGLLAVLTGMAFQRPQSGIMFLAAFLFFQTTLWFQPRFAVTNFLLPVYAVANLFQGGQAAAGSAWSEYPDLFGLPIHPIPFTLGLQSVIGAFLWRAAVRKTTSPVQPLLQRWETVALFGVLTAAQHGLIWRIWRGQFGAAQVTGMYDRYPEQAILPLVHCGTILAGTILLLSASPQPEQVRVEALRTGLRHLPMVFRRSAAPLALALTAVAGAALLAQCVFSIPAAGKALVTASGNLLDCLLIFSLLLEFCRLRFQRRALGFLTLGVFVLCVLPFVLAGVFDNETFARLSLLSPGVMALNHPGSEEMNSLMLTVLAHFGIAVILFLLWRAQWQSLLGQLAPGTAGR